MDPLLEALDQAQLQLLLLKCGIVPARADAHSQRLAGAYTRKGLLAVATDPDLMASILAGDGAPVLNQHKADAKAIQRYIAGGIDELAIGWGAQSNGSAAGKGRALYGCVSYAVACHPLPVADAATSFWGSAGGYGGAGA